MPETPETDFLADIGVLARKLGRPESDERVIDALKRASDRFRGEVRHHVSRKVEDELVLDGDGRRNLRLPVTHVQTVHEVTINDQPVEVSVSRHGMMRRKDSRLWPDEYGAIRVVVTHGLDPVPGDIQTVVLDQAETVYRVLRGLSSYQVGGISQSYGAAESVGVTEEWDRAVTRHQIRVGDRA